MRQSLVGSEFRVKGLSLRDQNGLDPASINRARYPAAGICSLRFASRAEEKHGELVCLGFSLASWWPNHKLANITSLSILPNHPDLVQLICRLADLYCPLLPLLPLLPWYHRNINVSQTATYPNQLESTHAVARRHAHPQRSLTQPSSVGT